MQYGTAEKIPGTMDSPAAFFSPSSVSAIALGWLGKLIIKLLSRITATWRDKLVLIWLIVTLALGLLTIFVSLGHRDGHEMVKLMTWAQHIVTFRGDAASYIADVSPLFKLHMLMGMGLFVIFPFTRLVHVWSGFASVSYLGRAWQLVRRR